MKVAIVGSRSITEYSLIEQAIALSGFEITEIVSGGARGVDTLSETYASNHSIPISIFKPDWNKYGKSAGFIRNKDIINYADACIAVWDGKSKGTLHSINLAKEKAIPLYVFEIQFKHSN